LALFFTLKEIQSYSEKKMIAWTGVSVPGRTARWYSLIHIEKLLRQRGINVKKFITVAHEKGGVSKTTTATNIAVEMKRRGFNVKVIDLDHLNKSSTVFFSMRDDIECELVSSIDELLEAIDFDGIIIGDSGGFDVETTRALITASDIVLIPFNPKSDKDIGGLVNFMDTMDEIRSVEGVDIKAFFVPSMLHHLADRDKSIAPISPLLDRGYSVAGTTTRRTSYETSGDTGRDVYEYGDLKASAEIKTIVDTIMKGL